MEKIIKALNRCFLFNGFSSRELQRLLEDVPHRLISYKKNQIIAAEGEPCSSIGIIIEGSVDIKKLFASGKSITITSMTDGDIFGEVLVFAQTNNYPSTIIASRFTTVLSIPRASVLKLSHSNMSFLSNIMSLLANKVLLFNEKISYLSLQSIRQKIANLLLDYSKKQNSLMVELPFSRKEMAELLDVPRPSLSREMMNMREEGLISFHKNSINILDLHALEELLMH